MKDFVLYPDHIYEVGKDIPFGYYCYFFDSEYYKGNLTFCEPDDAAFRMYEEYPSSRHRYSHGNFACVQVNSGCKYVQIENGIAIYYGKEKMDLYSLLHNADVIDGIYDATVYDNGILKIVIKRKDSTVHLFSGSTDALVWNQFWFTINAENYWIGNMNALTHKRYSSAVLCLKDRANGIEFTFTGQECGLSQFYLGNDYYVCRIPKELDISTTDIQWLTPSCASDKLFHTKKTVREKHSEIISKMEKLLTKYREIGLDLDICKEIEFLCSAPDLMYECYPFLEKCLNKKGKFDSKKRSKKQQITYVVRATYDKQFYCAAKLDDAAMLVEYDNARDLFYLTFDGSKIEEITLMYYNLVNIVNSERKDLTSAFDYIQNYDFYGYLQSEVDRYIFRLRDKYGYSGTVTSSVLISIIKAVKKKRKDDLNNLYLEMKRLNRVNSKWSSEYKLFMMIKNLVENAVYQYHIDWLGTQSFDIYLPTQKIAIEYQGQQHFESVSVFGGEEALIDNVFRDIRKQKLAEDNGITLLYWHYTTPINRINVVNFLESNKISFSEERADDDSIISGVEMAPAYLEPSKPKKTKAVKKYVVQYSLDGTYIDKYMSVSDASTKSGAGFSSINKVLMGNRHSAGRFVWRRFESDNIPDRIEIDFDVSKINDGVAK